LRRIVYLTSLFLVIRIKESYSLLMHLALVHYSESLFCCIFNSIVTMFMNATPNAFFLFSL